MDPQHVSEDGKWWWDGQKWQPVQEPLIDRARVWLWPIGGIGVGCLSIQEQLFSTSVWWHPLAPIIGLGASVVSLITGLVSDGVTKVVMGFLGVIGIVINLIAGVIVIMSLASH